MIPEHLIAYQFETTEYQLEDGTPLLLARDADKRWPIPSYDLGTPQRVLYELPSGYVIVEHDDGAFRSCRTVSDVEAVRRIEFARGPIPPRLQKLYASGTWMHSEEPPRPLEHWRDKHGDLFARQTAHEVEIPELTKAIIQASIVFVQYFRDGNPNQKAAHEVTGGMNSALYETYSVDPHRWWGSKSQIPPARVDILELQWPTGTSALQEAIRQIRNLLAPALICAMPSCFRLGNPDRPNQAEEEAAVTFLKEACPRVEELVVQIRKEVDKLENGETLEEARESGQIPVPSPEAFLAYWLRQYTGANQTDIGKMMMRAVGKHGNQGAVSKLLRDVDAWIAKNNKAPAPDPEWLKRAILLSPEILDLGKRLDGLTPRQRPKSDE